MRKLINQEKRFHGYLDWIITALEATESITDLKMIAVQTVLKVIGRDRSFTSNGIRC